MSLNIQSMNIVNMDIVSMNTLSMNLAQIVQDFVSEAIEESIGVFDNMIFNDGTETGFVLVQEI